MPLTASSPIEPPGKRSGCTTKLSVVKRERPLAERRATRGVAERRRAAPVGERGDDQPLDQRRLALPPAPWAIVICGVA